MVSQPCWGVLSLRNVPGGAALRLQMGSLTVSIPLHCPDLVRLPPAPLGPLRWV